MRVTSPGTGKLLPAREAGVAVPLLLMLLLTCVRLHAQVAPTAYDRHLNLWAGMEYSNFQPDYSPSDRLSGLGFYLDWSVNNHVAIEGEMRFLHFNGTAGETQDHYLIGPKLAWQHWDKLKPYAKILVGLGRNNFPYDIGYGKYFALAPGGGVDYELSRKWAVRADYEYQFWPAAPAVPGQNNNGMNPNGFSVGIAYRVLHR